MTKALVVGGGFSGCCAAHVLGQLNIDVDLVEKSDVLGGGVRTYWYGGHPYTVGPRHFLTENQEWFDFLNEYVPMRFCDKEHENSTYIESDKAFYTYPPHMDDIPRMPERDEIYDELKIGLCIYD